MTNEPMVIERSLRAPADRIWKALTDPQDMKQWYFARQNFVEGWTDIVGRSLKEFVEG